MKKLRLNKLFHWLYAFLMFMPIFVWIGGYVVNFATGNAVTVTLQDTFFINDLTGSYVANAVSSVYYYLFDNILGVSRTPNVVIINEALTYWTIVSLVYLIFDVLMYPINLFHKWIDEGGF